MICDLGQQEIKLPKATEISVTRETSASFVAANEELLNSRLTAKDNRGVNTAVVEASSRKIQTTSTHKTLSTALVRAVKRTDMFRSILKVGEPKGKSEYFYDGG